MEAVVDCLCLGSLEPFDGKPIGGVELPDGVVEVAMHVLIGHYENIGDAKSVAKVHKAYSAITNGKLLSVLFDGTVRIQGSNSVYLAGADCRIESSARYCPTYQGGKQGSCYHLWMREIVRIAQILTLDELMKTHCEVTPNASGEEVSGVTSGTAHKGRHR